MKRQPIKIPVYRDNSFLADPQLFVAINEKLWPNLQELLKIAAKQRGQKVRFVYKNLK